jgi:hypothetical protein
MYCSITGWRSMDVGPALEKLKPTCHRTLVRVRVRIRVACVVCDRGRACINGRRCGGPTGRGWQPRRGLLERCMCELTPSPVKRHCFLTQPIIARPFWGRHDPAHYRTLAWSGQHQRRPGQPMRLRRPSVRPSQGPLCGTVPWRNGTRGKYLGLVMLAHKFYFTSLLLDVACCLLHLLFVLYLSGRSLNQSIGILQPPCCSWEDLPIHRTRGANREYHAANTEVLCVRIFAQDTGVECLAVGKACAAAWHFLRSQKPDQRTMLMLPRGRSRGGVALTPESPMQRDGSQRRPASWPQRPCMRPGLSCPDRAASSPPSDRR